jgi:hypothetical protein
MEKDEAKKYGHHRRGSVFGLLPLATFAVKCAGLVCTLILLLRDLPTIGLEQLIELVASSRLLSGSFMHLLAGSTRSPFAGN